MLFNLNIRNISFIFATLNLTASAFTNPISLSSSCDPSIANVNTSPISFGNQWKTLCQTDKENAFQARTIDLLKHSSKVLAPFALAILLVTHPNPSNAAEGGASNVANSKLAKGGASTLQSGRTSSLTRGVNLDRSDFSNQNLTGVAFQQSIVRDANFKGSNLVGASFFDATLDGTDFEDADMTQVNLEMAQLSRANLKNAIVREMYVGGK
jgi:uncharacterized protein YjbI with pentapeptide repeats